MLVHSTSQKLPGACYRGKRDHSRKETLQENIKFLRELEEKF